MTNLGDGDRDDGPHNSAILPGFPLIASPANDAIIEQSEAVAVACVSAAHHILEGRKLRPHMFDGGMFGEPAWDMLLALFINKAGNIVTTRDCLARSLDNIPAAVAHRWQNYLEQQKLIGFTSNDHVRLTLKAREILTSYLAKVSGSGTLP